MQAASQVRGRRAINLSTVCEKAGVGKSAVYDAIKQGTFPAPAKIGRKSIWDESAVDAWLEARFAAASAAQAQGATR